MNSKSWRPELNVIGAQPLIHLDIVWDCVLSIPDKSHGAAETTHLVKPKLFTCCHLIETRASPCPILGNTTIHTGTEGCYRSSGWGWGTPNTGHLWQFC